MLAPRSFPRTLVVLLLAWGCNATQSGSAATWDVPFTSETFSFTEPAAWRIATDAGGPALELTRDSKYEPPFRSPHSIALVRDSTYRDFTLDLELKQTGPEYAHRDLCIFFGFESNERFYYVHLASTPDANAHNVFLVDHEARRNLLPPRSAGITWGTNAWHHVRVERNVAKGSIRVYFDDLENPVFDVEDHTLGEGKIGFGSFDDTGMFRAIRIRGERIPQGEATKAR